MASDVAPSTPQNRRFCPFPTPPASTEHSSQLLHDFVLPVTPSQMGSDRIPEHTPSAIGLLLKDVRSDSRLVLSLPPPWMHAADLRLRLAAQLQASDMDIRRFVKVSAFFPITAPDATEYERVHEFMLNMFFEKAGTYDPSLKSVLTIPETRTWLRTPGKDSTSIFLLFPLARPSPCLWDIASWDLPHTNEMSWIFQLISHGDSSVSIKSCAKCLPLRFPHAWVILRTYPSSAFESARMQI